MRCALCGRPAVVERLCLVRCAEMDDDGEIRFPQRECCPRCVGERAVLMPSRTIAAMVSRKISDVYKAIPKECRN